VSVPAAASLSGVVDPLAQPGANEAGGTATQAATRASAGPAHTATHGPAVAGHGAGVPGGSTATGPGAAQTAAAKSAAQASARPPSPSPNCDPPYTLDDQGHKKFKPECFLNK
jgi:serine/threonine-protein kinase